MDEGLDTGDIITQTEIPIGENETAGKLMERVAEIGAKQLVETLSRIEQGKAPRMPQKGEEATLAPVLKKEMGEFDFSRSAAELHNLVRGLSPWPSAYFFADGKKVKVLESRYIPEMQGGKGEVLSTDPLTIATRRGALALLQLVPEGSRPMSGTAFAAGKRWKTGSFLQK